MKYGVITTWRMGIDGINEVENDMKNGALNAGDIVEKVINIVEDFEFFKSVGYGGLPNEHCEVELDGAYMDGDTLDIGAVAALKGYSNPVSIARKLSERRVNCFLVGQGANEYAKEAGFEKKEMLTERAKEFYEEKKKLILEKNLTPYDGHDTIGAIALDQNGKMVVATSTSGLFMKKRGRVGDSPVIGSGFYVDSKIGGATATGLGEDLMKGCISYEIVRLMENGMSPQDACDKVVIELNRKLIERRGEAGDLSVVAMNKDGEWGVATNIKEFTFAVCNNNEEPSVYITSLNEEGKTLYSLASQEWLDKYLERIKSPVKNLVTS
ncbi:N(4)-(beta-N-acetylglucosaminyl)-L-asparaginase [Clostridium sp. B9]|uniref:N(4)-(beta-N-acetylglucosaminyl)-L-asparaginase n=1 Tax=Clostridium sp. B9 TaxID=3423224 RepID=UPI003D2F424E